RAGDRLGPGAGDVALPGERPGDLPGAATLDQPVGQDAGHPRRRLVVDAAEVGKGPADEQLELRGDLRARRGLPEELLPRPLGQRGLFAGQRVDAPRVVVGAAAALLVRLLDVGAE